MTGVSGLRTISLSCGNDTVSKSALTFKSSCLTLSWPGVTCHLMFSNGAISITAQVTITLEWPATWTLHFFLTSTTIISNYTSSSSSGSSLNHPRVFHSELTCHLFKNLTLTHSILYPLTLALNDAHLNSCSVSVDPLEIGPENRTWAYPGLPFRQPLWFVEALVNKLVPCAWLLSGPLEIWRLRLRLHINYHECYWKQLPNVNTPTVHL